MILDPNYRALPGDCEDPHDTRIVWYLNEVQELVYYAPPYAGWLTLQHRPLPATPERVALWITLRLEGHRG